VGGHHACALTAEGGVRCWGDNRYGQLGDGTTTMRSTAVFASGLTSGVAAIATGDWHTCALTMSGAVLCWGSNASGSVGDGSAVAQRNSPVPIPGLGSGVVAIAAGGADTCAVLTTGESVCWGRNALGQLGDGTTVDRNSPTSNSGVLGGVNAAAMAAGGASMAPGGDHTCMIAAAGSVVCTGDDSNGALGNGANTSTMSFVASFVSSDAVTIASNMGVSCAVASDGSVQCWGYGGHGQLGNGRTAAVNTPVTVPGLAVAGIAIGASHTCAVAATGAVFCWGDNSSGQLGDGTTTSHATPTQVPSLTAGVTEISTGSGTCALTATGAVVCWGPNSSGQIGDGSTSERDAPVPVFGFP
jgi:alpha-tubulin suppressor-like RCC1 family protein